MAVLALALESVGRTSASVRCQARPAPKGPHDFGLSPLKLRDPRAEARVVERDEPQHEEHRQDQAGGRSATKIGQRMCDQSRAQAMRCTAEASAVESAVYERQRT